MTKNLQFSHCLSVDKVGKVLLVSHVTCLSVMREQDYQYLLYYCDLNDLMTVL